MRRLFLTATLLTLAVAATPAAQPLERRVGTPPALFWPAYSPSYWPAVENWSRCGGGWTPLPAPVYAVPRKVTQGTPAKPIDVTRLKAADAPALFWKGVNGYWEGEHAAARELFAAASALRMRDARLYYFKALNHDALGETDDADAALKRGAELQRQGLPDAEEIGEALERVQGPARARIRGALKGK